ncbi:MAG: class I tRNA ligase family protein, partial [Desulfobacteraceae bacterium]
AFTWLPRIEGAIPFSDSPNKLSGEVRELYKKAHQTIRKVSLDIEERFHFNTAIAAVMELVNSMYGIDADSDAPYMVPVMRFTMETVILLLSPMVPHFSEEVWRAMGCSASVISTSWPIHREDALAKDEIEIVVQVNGKLRSRFNAPTDVTDDYLKETALADEKVIKFIGEKSIRKIIVVKQRLVNIVI